MSTPTFAKTHNLIAFLEKPSKSDGFEQIVDFLNANQIKYALTVGPTIYTACIKQFWTTLKLKTVNDDVRLQALIDGKKVIITEASIRHKLNDAKGTSCLPNAMIFEELAIIGAKTTSWNEFSSTMASAIICLANNQKFIFSKYILDNLKKNLEAVVPFYLFPRFIQIFVNHQIGNMSHHKGIYVNPSLTKKVFANMKRVGIGFSGAVTPLFDTMMVQAVEEVGDLPTAVQDTPIPDAPSSSQQDHVPTTSNDPLPSVIEMKSSYKEKIAELESRVEKLEEENRSLTKELKSFHTKIESLAFKETVMDKEKSSKHGKKITNIDADAEVNLENVYNLDMAHEEIVLSMQDVTDADGKEVNKEMVEVITTAKIIVDEVNTVGGKLNASNKEPVSAASTNITTAQPSEATKTTVDIISAPKAKGIVFHDMEESTTRTASSNSQVKDKGKAKLVEEPKVLKSRKAQIAIDKEVARRIEAEWNADMKDNIDWNEVVEQDNAEKQKLKEQQEAEELKRNLEIVPDDEDDVFVNVAPLSSKPPTIVDYKIYKEGKKEHFQIIRANGNHQMYLAFSIMLKNFNREDLKVLWKIIKERFKESQPKEVLDVFLWHTLKVMFEHSIEDSVWKL
nr:hypothetical protein [Tanacetum cinerariifolium]